MAKSRFEPKSDNQRLAFEAIQKNVLTILLGPAGSGKTFLSVAAAHWAISFPTDTKINKIVVARPLVGADEELGSLPGDSSEKTDPFFIPVRQELEHFWSVREISSMLRNRDLEFLPFSFMRGRNCHNSILIVDEAQNCTLPQLKLVISRLGRHSKIVITGDPTQSDLPKTKQGALTHCARRLAGVSNCGVVELTKMDIVRNPLLADILEALE